MIINADDFGISKKVNEAIDQCFTQGLINQTTLLVNMPFTEDAVAKSFYHGYSDKVGLHINLVEGIPLTDQIKHTSLCDKDGHFNESIIRKKASRFFLNGKTKRAVKKEIEAQINRYINYGFTLKHIDSHEHVHTNLSIIPILIPLLKENGFKSIRLARNIPLRDIHGIKAIYKTILNKYFFRVNRFSNIYKNIQYFGSLRDTESSTEEIKNHQELMVHPIMNSNNIIDAIYECDLDEWKKRNI